MARAYIGLTHCCDTRMHRSSKAGMFVCRKCGNAQRGAQKSGWYVPAAEYHALGIEPTEPAPEDVVAKYKAA